MNNIHEAIIRLSKVDDGAISLDGNGFNKFDIGYGNDLASKIMSGCPLSEKQELAAWKMAWKYRGQLDFDIPQPPKEPAPTKTAKIYLQNGMIHIVFGQRPTPTDRAFLDILSYRKWEPNLAGMPWLCKPQDAKKILAHFENRPEWDYSEEFIALANSTDVPQFPMSGSIKPKIDVDGSKILFYFGGKPSPEYRIKLDSLSDRKWNPDRDGKPWEAPISVIKSVSAIFSNCQFTQNFNAELIKQDNLSTMSRAATTDFDVPGMRTSLLPFQRAGVEFLELAGGRALLADEMGLGKTAQALAYMQLHLEIRPAIIVVPASLKINWVREIKKFMTSKDRVAVLSGTKPNKELLANTDIIILNYDILSAWLNELKNINPQIVIADEAHKAKNQKSQRGKAIKELAKIAKAFIPMTGTPMRNRPIELFTFLSEINPGAWSNWWKYANRYCGVYSNGFGMQFGEPENLNELHERIKAFVIRRTKTEVMKELPPKIRTTIVLEFDEAERAEYNEYIYEASRTQDHHLAIIEKAKQAAALGKLPAAINWIEEFLESGEKLVVFANHREITKRIYEKFRDQAVMIIGGISQAERQSAVDRFQDDPNVNLFVGNMEAAGVGITLTAASNVAIIEFPWTPDTVEQAIDRCHRIGQTDSVTAWFLVAENTIEESIVEMLQSKAGDIHEIMDNKNTEQDFHILSNLLQIIRTQTENIREINTA